MDATTTTSRAFERTSKRRKGFPSETHVKRGRRVVHGCVELEEKLGRNDLCPCGSGRRFQALLHEERALRRRTSQPLLLGTSGSGLPVGRSYFAAQRIGRSAAANSASEAA